MSALERSALLKSVERNIAIMGSIPKSYILNPKSSPKRLVLIDAHAILHRAYHALPQFSNSRGEPTGGLYGLAAMLLKIITTFKPDYIAAAYDLPKPTFRHEAYKAYKDGRAKADDALVAQMKRSREVFEAFNIPIYDKEGFEADDVLGTIVEQITNHQSPITKKDKLDSRLRGNDRQVDIVIASGDMDTLQLVDDKRVQVFTLKKGINDTILYDEAGVKARFGFGPELLPDFKGLKGDPSDNIKGIAGIGDKTATELILAFGSIAHLYQTLKKGKEKLLKAGIKPRVIELLEKGKEEAEFSKLLATIRRDVPITFSFPKESWSEGIDISKAEALFGELEFRQLTARLKDAVNKVQGVEQVAGEGLAADSVSHTRGEKKKPKNENGNTPAQASLTDALAASGIPPLELKETSVALWLINSNLTNPPLEDIFAFAKTKDFKAARAIVLEELRARHLTRVFEEIEKPLIPIVEKMNGRGVQVDIPFLRILSREYHKELSLREKAIWKLSGEEFNINSPKQLGEVLFNKMGLKVTRPKKTAGGAVSTRESELEKIRDLHPIIGNILEYREFQKLLSTYIDTIPTMTSSKGRLYAQFLQAGTTTGRMGSQNPNLQNIPIQTKLGQRIRNAFIAEKGSRLLSIDYSQIELRVAAILSGDRKLIDIFKRGEDVHTAVASEVFKVAKEKVTKEMRRQAKVINFGMLYGMGVNSLRSALSEGGEVITREAAQSYYNAYFTDFYELAGFLEKVKRDAYEKGYTETLFGRRRYHEAIKSNIPYIRGAAERMAINAPIQGTGADIVKLAMVRVDEWLRKEKLDTHVGLILQVHDELVYEVEEGILEEVIPKIKEIMQNVVPIKESRGVPIVVEASVGESWGEMEKVQK